MTAREEDLLRLLNSAPVVNGEIVETLDDPDARALRDLLQHVVKGEAKASVLGRYLDGIVSVPNVSGAGVTWTLTGPRKALPLAEIVLEWARVERELPGRLRPCDNPECNKYLIDHSKPNTARWCSMARCGNRMKARRYQRRHAGEAAKVDA